MHLQPTCEGAWLPADVRQLLGEIDLRWGPVELKRWRQSQERSANTAAVCGCVLHPMWCTNSLAQSHADSMPEAVTLSSPCTQHLGGAAWSCLQRQAFGTV